MLKNKFAAILFQWNSEKNDRPMPWKGEKDPYKIWISEIILQQTRVDQGREYYKRFINAFPTVEKLASSPEDKLFKQWEGLGYYSRCRNLLVSAKRIVDDLNGVFPASYEEIKMLKGVGPYTAAAVSSFAFNLPHAVVDGNVYRVLSRVFGITEPVGSIAGKKRVSELAQQLLDKQQPGLYNQAIMDFGATVCKPLAPLCETCVFKRNCYAISKNRIQDFPAKKKKTGIKKRWFYYLVVSHRQQGQTCKFAIQKRTGKDIWQDLFEFPLIESKSEKDPNYLLAIMQKDLGLVKSDYSMTSVSPLFKQQLSHQLIHGRFINIQLSPGRKLEKEWLWVEKHKLRQYAFPRYINQFLDSHL